MLPILPRFRSTGTGRGRTAGTSVSDAGWPPGFAEKMLIFQWHWPPESRA